MSFIIKDLSYIHADKEILFSHLHLSINSGDKIALTGNNGCGKSTLMRILAGDLSPSSGTVLRPEHLYYVPQHFGQYDRQTIAQALGISHKLSALHAILSGDATEKHFNTLNDDWNVEERAQTSLDSWGLDGIPLSRPMEGLSGGEKTRIFLAGMELHNPTAILLDEPTNYLDADGRERLYNLIRRTSATVLVISHDRTESVACHLRTLLPGIDVLQRKLRLLQKTEGPATESPYPTTGREAESPAPCTQSGTRSRRTEGQTECAGRKKLH